jgi:hypothetical protein
MMDNFRIRSLLLLLLTFALQLPAAAQGESGQPGEPLASPSTGMEAALLNLVLPGSQLEPKALEDLNSPIVLRVMQVFPHVDDWRYDLSFYGLVPGRYDLRDYLQRKDGSAMDGVPPIPVEVLALRPIGELVRPNLEPESPPRLGGYKLALIAAGVFWLGVMALLLFGFKKKTEAQLEQRIKPVTLADVLRPLVKQAQAGELSQSGQAQLERTLLGVWRKRLHLEDEDPAAAIIKLRADQEAGALLRELEKWLHKPGAAGEVDLAELLKPYENLPAEEG